MSLSFPTQPCSVILGALFAQSSAFIVRRAVCGTMCSKAQSGVTPREDADPKKPCSVLKGFATTLASALLQSYAINSLIFLTGASSYKSGGVIGSLAFFVTAGQELISNVFVAKKPLSAMLSHVFVNAVDTVGVAMALMAIKGTRNWS